MGSGALGDAAPDGPILGARVEHLVAKDALMADDPAVYFTTPHFDGYPALVRLDQTALDELEEVIAEAWLCQAAQRLAAESKDSWEAGLDSQASIASTRSRSGSVPSNPVEERGCLTGAGSLG